VSERIIGVKTLYLTPVESVKINAIIGGDIDFEPDRDLTLRALGEVIGDRRMQEVDDWLASGHEVKFVVVLR
jgi:hypothetical protein